MRRVIAPALLFATTLAGCSEEAGFNDSTVIATIGEAQLTAAQLEAYLLQAPEAPTIVQGQALLSLWLDHAGIVVANARGEALSDPAVRDEAMAPDLLRASIVALAGQTRGARPAPSDAQVDSLARLDQVRVFERFSITITDPSDSAAAREAIGKMLALRAEIGTIQPEEFTFERIPAAMTQGMERSTTNAFTRGDLPTEIAAPLWRLEPGMVSDVLGGAGAVQVFIRLPAIAGREPMRRWLADRLNLRADAAFVDSLAADAALTFADEAIPRLRALAREPITAASAEPLGTFKDGGEVTVADARSWLGLMPVASRAGVMMASDSGVSTMLTEMGKRAIMRRIAPAPSPEAVAGAEQAYSTRLDSLTAALSAVPGADDVTARTNAWLGELLGGRRPLVPLPGALGLVLRDRFGAAVNYEALEWVVTRAGSAWTQKAGQTT